LLQIKKIKEEEEEQTKQKENAVDCFLLM